MAKDKTPSDVSKMIKDNDVKLIDFKFTDLLGTWQHFTTTLTEYNEEIFTDGLGFDGSSIRGWRVINASDMLVIPDAATAWIDVFNAEPTLSLICTIVDPITREPYDRDPRGVAEKAEAYLKSTGIADTAFFGPEAEFFIFDDVRFANSGNAASYMVDSVEGHWNSAREEFPNLGYKIRPKEGYFPVSPMDSLQDIRNEMCLELEKAGVAIERQRHGALFHWRDFETCACAHLPDEPNYQQLQAARSRVRSAGQSRLFGPQSLRRHSNSDLFAKPESKARRIPYTGRRC